MRTTDAEFDYLSDDSNEWLSDLETRAIDLENEISEWRESHQRGRPDQAARRVPSPGWPRDARYVEGDPDVPKEDEPAPHRRATRQASDAGARYRARSSPAVPRANRRSGGADPPSDEGRGVPRPARYADDPDASGDPGRPRPRASKRTVDPDLADDAGPGVPRAARYAADRDASRRVDPTFPRSPGRTNEGGRSASGRGAGLADERTRILIAHGRRNARRGRLARARNITVGVGIGTVIAIVLFMIVFRSDASWPASVAVVQNEIATACQNPNVAAEPNQVNFACGKGTQQVLWVFSLMTTGDNPTFADPKSGREGLEPITPAQGGEVAWSLDLHHPYDPFNPIDSLEVAARAINNIIGGASLTASNGKPVVQPGLLSNPANCAKYTGSPAVIARAGFPDICAEPVTSPAGQAALVADAYSQWLVGAPLIDAQEASILFENASDPGNAQVQAILKTLPGASATS